MGLGDEIMVTGEARLLHEKTGKRVKIRGPLGNARTHTIFDNNPRIARPDEEGEFAWIESRSGHRPYVDYARTTKQRWAYTGWKCSPGELYIEREPAGGTIVIEPHIKPNASPNKLWGFDRSQALVDLVDENWVQLGPMGTEKLKGVALRHTASFLDACRALSGAKCYVGPEGGLHHAAAALGIPAVVIFGGMTSPANTGYDMHVNLFVPDGSPCGWRVPCEHCDAAMASITPETVASVIPAAIEKGKTWTAR